MSKSKHIETLGQLAAWLAEHRLRIASKHVPGFYRIELRDENDAVVAWHLAYQWDAAVIGALRDYEVQFDGGVENS